MSYHVTVPISACWLDNERMSTLPRAENEPSPVRPWAPFLTATQAAAYAGCHPGTIRRFVRPAGVRGRTRVYRLEDVDRWIAGTPIEVAP